MGRLRRAWVCLTGGWYCSYCHDYHSYRTHSRACASIDGTRVEYICMAGVEACKAGKWRASSVPNFNLEEVVVYQKGTSYKICKIVMLYKAEAMVWFEDGGPSQTVPILCLHKIDNDYVKIGQTNVIMKYCDDVIKSIHKEEKE